MLTAVGHTFNGSCTNSGLKVNGKVAVGIFTNLGCGSPTSGSSLVSVPAGFTVASGSSVEPTGYGEGRAWGYLADESARLAESTS